MSFELSALLVTWLAILLLALVVSGLIRQVHALSARGTSVQPGDLGLAPGTRAPELARLTQGRERPGTLLLLFLTEGCGVCDLVLEEAVAQAGKAAGQGIAVHAIFPGSAPPPAQAATDGVRVWEDEPVMFERYKIAATPFGIAVDERAMIFRSEPVGSDRALSELLANTAADRSMRS